jgi:hypothetical protein
MKNVGSSLNLDLSLLCSLRIRTCHEQIGTI